MALFCPNCGKNIEKNDKFCKYCGTSIFAGEKDSVILETGIDSDEKPNTLTSKLKDKAVGSINKAKEEYEDQIKEIKERQEQQERQRAEKKAIRQERIKRILSWIKGLDKRIKIGAVIVFSLLMIALLIWIFGLKKPHDEAEMRFSAAVSNYSSTYSSYKAQADSYNSQIDSAKNSKEKATEAITSIERLLNDAETIEDESLLDEMKGKVDSYKSSIDDEISATPVVIMARKEYSSAGLKTRDINALTEEIKNETNILEEEREHISGMMDEIDDISYLTILNEINDLKDKYDEAVKMANGFIYAPTESMSGKNYADVAKLFQKQGFTDIKVQGMGDLIIALLHSEGEIEEVSVGGITDYSRETMYDSSTEVIIRYHSHDRIGPVPFGEEIIINESNTASESDSKEKKEDETQDISEGTLDDDVEERINNEIGNPLPELVKYINESGYKALYIAENSGDDFTDWIADEPEVAESFLVYGCGEINKTEKTVTVYIEGIETAENKKQAASNEDKLNSKLDEFVAWDYVERYGNKQYPYGFKLHYMLDKYAATAEDENTWFLKAGCTVTNAYGTKLELVCEARVSGTEAKPNITYFVVY